MQPVSGGDHLAHGGADVGVEVVPNEHDRSAQLLVGGVEQAYVVAFAEAAAFVLAAAVGDGAVDHSGTLAGFVAGQAGNRDSPEALARDRICGVSPRRPQVRAFGGRSA
ncbi:hypothetical protein Axi01nite_93310 [Actinoplanes xinjiangensis]|nr:hypothetical protein Axi01nite_93310 [Actinoplanes xinjiangensis]